MSTALWRPPSGGLKTTATTEEITSSALQLSDRERKQVLATFKAQNFEMASSFVWTRAMAGLKKQLGALGVTFLAEMLERSDIKAHDSVVNVITDYEAVALADQLGMFGPTEAMRLRQAMGYMAHFSGEPEEGDETRAMSKDEASVVLRACVQNILRHESMSNVTSFAEFRKKLEETKFTADDPEIKQLVLSPPFYQRTALRVLLAAARARSVQPPFDQYVLANLDLLVRRLWGGLLKPDRWAVGRTYAELHNDGNTDAADALRAALVAVGGFDFVPENLRSATFTDAAAKVLNAHNGFDNFYNEREPMELLAGLGSVIPQPALAKCVSATLAVRMGNFYGPANTAQAAAKKVLDNITPANWTYYLEECLQTDIETLGNLERDRPFARWKTFVVAEQNLVDRVPITDPLVKALVRASANGDDLKARAAVKALRQRDAGNS